jgi:hypothetical protein
MGGGGADSNLQEIINPAKHRHGNSTWSGLALGLPEQKSAEL